MTNTAIINKIEGDKIFLTHIKDYGKKELTERSFWKVKVQDFQSSNPNNLQLEVGDAVEYQIPEKETIFASFLILILPLILFIVSFYIFGLLGISSEKIKALLSIGVLFISFFINRALKKAGFKEKLPIILKKLDKERLKEIKKSCSSCGSCSACDS